MGRIVIAAYRPKPGKEGELKALMATHLSTLRSQDLVTERESVMMEAADGTILEVFEWHPDAATRMTAHGDFVAVVRPCLERFVAEGLIGAWGLTGIGHPDAIIDPLGDRPGAGQYGGLDGARAR